VSLKARNPVPHITLMHPRNSTCTDEIFEELKKLKFALTMKFDRISLIEQVNNGKWKILENFNI
jgi:2'-5' RNA ligase